MTPTEEFAVLHADAGVVTRDGRAAVLVTGPDAFSFLQALVSADVDPLVDGAGLRSLLLAPQGKLDVAFRLLRVGDDAWLDADPGMGAHLAESLTRFRIRVDAEIVDRTPEWGIVSVIGPRSDVVAAVEVPGALHSHVEHAGVRLVRTEFGFDVVGPAAAVSEAVAGIVAAGVTSIGPAAADAFRIEHGVPLQPVDIDDSTIPQEAFLEQDAVSFTKGCFLGQELVCRIDSRGHVNRFLRRIVDIDGAWPSSGDEIVAGGRVVGEITSVADPDLGVGGLGYVRREVEPSEVVELRTASGAATARVDALR
jgi:folate-binding protein YgfZ